MKKLTLAILLSTFLLFPYATVIRAQENTDQETATTQDTTLEQETTQEETISKRTFTSVEIIFAIITPLLFISIGYFAIKKLKL